VWGSYGYWLCCVVACAGQLIELRVQGACQGPGSHVYATLVAMYRLCLLKEDPFGWTCVSLKRPYSVLYICTVHFSHVECGTPSGLSFHTKLFDSIY
jgi:hypothetical protein